MEYRSSNGKLVAIEGIDGAGKTRLVQHLAPHLETKGLQVKIVNRYMVSELTELWHQLVNANAIDQSGAAILAAADYSVGLKRYILPALTTNKIVLSDRYFYSHIVYFASRGVSLEELQKIFYGALVPDLIFYIDISAETALDRLRTKMKPDFWECGLDYRLGAKIGQAYHNYQRKRLQNEVLDHHFLEHQSLAPDLYAEILPKEVTCTLNGHLAPSDLLGHCVQELINRLDLGDEPFYTQQAEIDSGNSKK
jgi:dTMP kinase